MTQQDQWSKWLLETRFGGDAEAMARGMAMLHLTRDRVLKNAALQEGETLLDVGCGDGLIAFGALNRVGDTGHVVFSDVSAALLAHCKQLAQDSDVVGRCSFVKAPADDLSAIDDASVDVVTTRSVLIYVQDKAASFREFRRVLRPGGRVSIFEPINRFNATYALETDRWGAAGTAVEPLAARVRDYFARLQPLDTDPMLDFDEHDLLRLVEEAGFTNVHLEYHVLVLPAPPSTWEVAMKSPGNPNIPSLADAMRQIFSDEERAQLEKHLRPQIEAGGRVFRSAVAYLTARKDT